MTHLPSPHPPKTGGYVKGLSGQIGRGRLAAARAMSFPMGNNLKKLRSDRGWTQQQAADSLGLSLGGYEKIERSSRRLSADRIAKISEIFQVSQAEVLGEPTEIPIIGEVYHAGIVNLYEQDTVVLVGAPRPQGAGAGMVALLVAKGVALPGIAEENWVIYADEKVPGVPEAWIGALCLIQTESGERHVRRVFHGRIAGTFDLVLSGYEVIRDVRVATSAKVEWIKPR